MNRWLLLLCIVLFTIPTLAQDDNLSTRVNIPYNDDGNPRQVLDLHRPDDVDEPLPVIFMVHGGGFVFGSQEMLFDVARRYAGMGYAVVTPTYRLAPINTYPAAIEDVFCALAWTFENADEFNVDLSRLVLVGESAGANAAAIIATVADPSPYLTDCPYALPDDYTIQGVVAVYLPVDLSTCDCDPARGLASLYLGIDNDDWEQAENLRDLWAEASPLAHLDEDDPPFILIHGTDDSFVPYSESELFVETYQALGGEVELFPIEGADHGYFDRVRSRPARETYAIIDAWLQDVLAPETAQN